MDPGDLRPICATSAKQILNVLGVVSTPMLRQGRVSLCRAASTVEARSQQRERLKVIEEKGLEVGLIGIIDGKVCQISAIADDGYLSLSGRKGRFNPARFMVTDD